MNIFTCQNPESVISQQQSLLLASNASSVAFSLEFSLFRYYLTEPDTVALIALIYLHKTANDMVISAAVFSFDSAIKTAISQLNGTSEALQHFANQCQVPWLELSAPLMLEPVKIPKPWGQEFWYTGIEARGQASVIAQGFKTPLPWVLALLPHYLAANYHKKIILLKILDPLPDEVYGDLYFELHEQKQEVYVVTDIDAQAWPNKIGAIRLGFNQHRLSQFATLAQFKTAYLMAVTEYKSLRSEIDQLLDKERTRCGIGLKDPLDITRLSHLMQSVPAGLQQQERDARAQMDSFSEILPLQVGDVVKIPCRVAHALQHGVRTLEFQTPVYERKILSFAQKTLTQAHWDTESALASADFSAQAQQALPILFKEQGVLLEEVVRFDDFQVLRVTLEPYREYRLQSQNSYGLLMPVGNSCNVLTNRKELNVAAETAVFLPCHLLSDARQLLRVSSHSASVQVLIAVASV